MNSDVGISIFGNFIEIVLLRELVSHINSSKRKSVMDGKKNYLWY